MKYFILLFLLSCSTPKKHHNFTFTCFSNGQISATGTNDGIEIYQDQNMHLCKLDIIKP